MQTILIDQNADLLKGDYIVTFTASIFPETIATILNEMRGILGSAIEVIEGKEIIINKVESKEIDGEIKILFHFTVIKNPVPVVAIIVAILALLGVFGAFMTLDKVEQIIDTPVGAILGSGALLVVVGIIILLFLFLKRKQ